MSGLSKEVCFCITRLKTTFVDSLGNKPKGIATGFWVLTEIGNRIFVTNKHSLDISMKYSSKEKFDFIALELELRKKKNDNFMPETEFFYVSLEATKIIYGEKTDLALIVNPGLQGDIRNFGVQFLKLSDWGPDEEFFIKRSRIASDVSFVGFPMNLFDSKWKLPIARHAIIASVSEIYFSHDNISSEGIILVSGLSFEGGSGSPVFSSSRGQRINCDVGFVESDDYCPQKLLGIMTGHLQLQSETKEYITKKEESFTRHTGLSYFTKSLYLINLIKNNNL